MITTFNAQLLNTSVNTAALANTVGANGQISYDYETNKLYIHDGFGNKFSSNLTATIAPPSNQYGSSYGYTVGLSPIGWYTSIQKASLTSDEASTAVGTLVTGTTIGGNKRAASSSDSYGYVTGGRRASPPSSTSDTIEKYSFTSDGDSSEVAELTLARYGLTGTQSITNGYASGGVEGPGTTRYNIIEKFPFSSDASATDVGDLSETVQGSASSASETHGYNMGGSPSSPTPSSSAIRQYSFSSDGPATTTASLLHMMMEGAGTQSETNGYFLHGTAPINLNPAYSDKIQKFNFASNTDAVDVGELVAIKNHGAAYSSQDYGYKAGGGTSTSAGLDTLEKFPFSSDAPSIDIAELLYNVYAREGSFY